ncbi:hypothetical protein ECDEC1E_0301 [Escherichia coli DEC1E]|nr:hypothetical protein EC236275_2078 [Escherichia coli 2362-75]EHU32584.1 hypothetical protein ECDEC1E_0301 [Escherichia coli DEC1E]
MLTLGMPVKKCSVASPIYMPDGLMSVNVYADQMFDIANV